MKKTLFYLHCILLVSAFTIFTACNKEMDSPVSNSNPSYSVTPATQMMNTSAVTKKPIGYTGQSTLGDSTKAGTQP